MTVAIIGSGFAGSAAAHALRLAGRSSIVFEAKPYSGGHTHTEVINGVTVDEGPHVSFTKDERVRKVFAEGAGEIEELSARITNYFEGHWITHPAQVHLHGLDPHLVTDCISDFVDAQQNPPKVETYADWLVAMYGRTFAERFPFRYTRKYWTVEPDQLGVDWVGSRMYPPKLEEVVKGALMPDPEGEFHYFKTYRYPSHGGYQSFMAKLVEGADIRTGKEVVAVDSKNKRLTFADGTSQDYDDLVSTMPLDKLVKVLDDVPAEVSEAAERLLCSSVVLVDIGVDRADLFDHDWFYVYDEEISMSRVHFPHHLSPHNAPAGTGAIQAEVYFSRMKPLETPIDQLGDRVVDEFIQMGILRDRQELRFVNTRVLEYANIVFDHHRQPSLDVILPFVAERGIKLAGRFGEWGYHWTDDSTIAGWNAAEAITGRSIDDLLG